MIERPFTPTERVLFLRHAERIRDSVDAELGELLFRVGNGDDGALDAVHSRLNILGRFELADRLRKLVVEE